MFKKNKILIISITVIIILIAFLFYQKMEEDKFFNTYHNQTYNYSFKYPQYLEQSVHCSGDDPVFIAENPQDFNSDAVSVVTSLANFNNLDEWLQKENEYWQNYNKKRIVETEIEIDNNKAFVTYLETSITMPNLDNQNQVGIEKGESRKTVFVKNNVLFEINTRFIANQSEQQKIWDSFKIADFKQINTAQNSAGIYVNQYYNYFINYGDNLRVSEFCFGYPNNVSLSAVDPDLSFNLVNIAVLENTSFKTIQQWQEAENAKNSVSLQKFEKNILIDDYPAQVFYSAAKNSLYEDEPYNKKTVFIKDNNLFIISTYFGDEKDHQAVWDNFKFIENNLSQIEDWNLYQEITDKSLKANILGDHDECVQVEGFNQEFADFKKQANRGSIKQFLYDGVLSLAITPNYNNWTNDQFLALSADNGAICSVGHLSPVRAYEDKLLWNLPCSSGAMPEKDDPTYTDFIKCTEAEQTALEYFSKN
jgi:hypothetical protein